MKPLIALIALTSSILAADLTIGETTYREYTVTRVEPDGLTISHADGTAKIPFKELPEELQKKHGYDPKKAADYAKSDANARAIRAAKERDAAAVIEIQKIIEEHEKAGVEADYKVDQVFDDGILATVQTYGPTGNRGRAFIHGKFTAVDGDTFTGKLYPAGRFTYGSVLGAKKTVTAFATSAAVAVAKFQK